MTPEEIKEQCTYQTPSGMLLYVQQISGKKVTYSKVGTVDRFESSINRFAATSVRQVPNR
jgi:hypothetical protein